MGIYNSYVARGQLWENRDSRRRGRFAVLNVDENFATVWNGTRTSQIRLDRFNPTNHYRLVRST